MSPCATGGGITLCYGPPVDIIDVEPSHVAWCFKCREHRMFILVYEDPQSPWFDPEWRFCCDRCGGLQTDFHGNCTDLHRWPEEAREASDRILDRSDEWPPCTVYDEFERPVTPDDANEGVSSS